MPTSATIGITPGSGQLLDAVSLVISAQTVVRETMVLADPTSATQLAGVTAGGALQVDASATTQPIFGTLTPNNAVPDGHNIGVLPAIANVAAPTYAEGKQVLLSTDLTGALRVNVGAVVASNNITEWNTVALGSPSAYGTGPGAVNVIGVNAFVTSLPAVTVAASQTIAVTNTGTFAVQATLAAETTKVIGTVNQGTSPWVISGAITLASTTVTGTVAVTQSTSPWVVSNGGTFAVQAACTQTTSPWIVAGGGTAGTAATGVVTVQGIASMTPLLVTATFASAQHVIVDSGTITAVTSITNPVAVTGTFWQATQPVSIASGQVASGAFASGSIASGAAAAGAFADGSVFVRSNAASTFPVTATIAAAQTIAVTNAGTFAVQDTVLDAALIAQEATTSGIKGLTAFGAVTTGAPTYTTGKSDALSLDVAGNLRIILNAETTKVIGTVNQGTSPWVISGAVTTSGTATVVGTLTNNNAAPSSNNVGALTAIANAAVPSFTEGDQVLQSVDLSGHMRVVATGAAATGAAVSGNPVLVGGKDNVGNARSFACTAAGLIGTMLNVTAIDGQSNANASIPADGGGGSGPVITFPLVFNGSTWDRQRTPNKFNTASVAATATGNTAVWTPTSGKKFRLMKFQVTAQGLAATATGVVTVTFQDATTQINTGAYDVDVPAVANVTSGTDNVSGGWIDLGNGYLSAAANNVLNFNISAAGAGTVGTYRINVAGTEE